MLGAANEIITFFIGILFGTGIGYAIRDLLQIRKEQEEQQKQYVQYVVNDHINCRCAISYPDETLEGGKDD